MSLLTERPPVSLCGVAVRTDFRDIIKLQELLANEDIPHIVRLSAALELFYTEMVADVQLAWDEMLGFLQAGTSRTVGSSSDGKKVVRLYDFEQDGDLIWAAFLAQYGVDLCEVEYLHWWKFVAMFRNLDEGQQISRIMGWRGADTRDMSKKMAERYKVLKREYALKSPRSGERISLAERDRRMKARVDRMFADAEVVSDG